MVFIIFIKPSSSSRSGGHSLPEGDRKYSNPAAVSAGGGQFGAVANRKSLKEFGVSCCWTAISEVYDTVLDWFPDVLSRELRIAVIAHIQC